MLAVRVISYCKYVWYLIETDAELASRHAYGRDTIGTVWLRRSVNFLRAEIVGHGRGPRVQQPTSVALCCPWKSPSGESPFNPEIVLRSPCNKQAGRHICWPVVQPEESFRQHFKLTNVT